jgi:hypothetical protein
MMLRRLLLVSSGVVAVLVAGMLPAAAMGGFGPSTIEVAGCPGPAGDAAIASNGTVRGFVACTGNRYSPIIFFEQFADGTHHAQAAPFSGRVLAVAWDGADATYVVYEQNSRLLIGKRVEHNGSYLPSTLLAGPAGVVPFTADLVAWGNRWWAVWSEQVGPGGEFAHTQLFQRHTLLGMAGRARITITDQNVSDLQPSLTYYANRVTMAWTRITSPGLPGPSEIRLARNFGFGWQSNALTGVGPNNSQPDLIEYAGITYVTWNRNGFIWYADNATGPFLSHHFTPAGVSPTVTLSGPFPMVSWTTDEPANRVMLAQRTGKVWTTGPMTVVPSTSIRVLEQAEMGRLVFTSGSAVVLRE